MIRVCIVCEGATEVAFVNSCLQPHLQNHGVHAYPVIVQGPSGRRRGGCVTVERLALFIAHQYPKADRLTTLVDYYGFKDAQGRTRAELERDILNGAIKNSACIDRRFVCPYVQMHEFEGLLFSDVEQFKCVLDGFNDTIRKNLIDIRAQFQTPEDINNSFETAPSKRILASFPNGSYSKTEHGPMIAQSIGLENIRQQCPQFAGWMTMLEGWGK